MTRRGRAPAAGRAPQGVLLQYAEEPKEGGTRLRVAQSAWMIAALQQKIYA
jgi:hypothetical protein